MADVLAGNLETVLRGAMRALHTVATEQGGVPTTTLTLMYLRASQINGRGACVDACVRFGQKVGESMDRLLAVADWRGSSHFTAPERAALALTEVVTALRDPSDPVPDEIWDDTVRYYDEPARAALMLSIAVVNAGNRLNITARPVAEARGSMRPRFGAGNLQR